MRIGEVAERAAVTVRTIRHYESLGLIPRGSRTGNGQHVYEIQTVERLRKIDQLKKLGLNLDEIGAVIDLYFTDGGGIRAKKKVLEMLRRHLVDADTKAASLEEFRVELRTHIKRFERWLAQKDHEKA